MENIGNGVGLVFVLKICAHLIQLTSGQAGDTLLLVDAGKRGLDSC